MKITPQIVILFLFTSFVPIILLAAAFYLTSQKILTDQVGNQLSSVAQVQKGRIWDFVTLQKERVDAIAHKTQIHQYMQDYAAKRKKEDLAALSQSLQDASLTLRNLSDIMILTASGSALVSVQNSIEGKNFAHEEFFQKGKEKTNATVFSKDEKGQVFYFVTTPFLQGDTFIGMLVIKTFPREFINLFANRDGLGETGEAYVAKRDTNGDALYITPLRFDKNAMLTRKVNKNDASFVVNRALAKQESVFPNSIDYNGKPVIAVSRYINDLDWGMVIKIDQAEAYKPLSFIISMIGFIVSLSLILVIGIAVYFAHSITKPLILLSLFAQALERGDLSKRTPVNSQDEIGMLERSFNTMAQNLQDMYTHLEAKVAAKTADILEEKQKLQAVLENIPVGVLLAKAPNGETVMINHVGLSIFGKRFDITAENSEYDVVRKDGTLYPIEELPLNITLKTKSLVSKTGIYLRKKNGGLYAALRVSSAPIFGAMNTLEYVVVVFEDVTKEEEVDRMKTEFISLASHQLRTPLTAIKWFTELLIDESQGKLNEAQEKYATNVNISTKRMINLVNALLNISRLETGRIIIDSRPTNLKKLIEDVVDEVKVKYEDKKQAVRIHIDAAIGLISLDPQMIRQVYLNLLANAIKYTPEHGQITISVIKKGQEVISEVMDNGYGIPKEEEKQVFQKFYRGGNVVKKVTEGTGLGLYLVKAIVEASKGRIWFETKEGKGTSFFFSLPVAGVPSKPGEIRLS